MTSLTQRSVEPKGTPKNGAGGYLLKLQKSEIFSESIAKPNKTSRLPQRNTPLNDK